jgi:hypothetical protein
LCRLQEQRELRVLQVLLQVQVLLREQELQRVRELQQVQRELPQRERL